MKYISSKEATSKGRAVEHIRFCNLSNILSKSLLDPIQGQQPTLVAATDQMGSWIEA